MYCITVVIIVDYTVVFIILYSTVLITATHGKYTYIFIINFRVLLSTTFIYISVYSTALYCVLVPSDTLLPAAVLQ